MSRQMNCTLACSQPSAAICQLPTEMLDNILSFLPVWQLDHILYARGDFYRDHLHAISHLSRSCRGLHKIVEPAMYTTLVGEHGAYGAKFQAHYPTAGYKLSTRTDFSHTNTRFRKLLRTLLARPRLASFVRTLVILPWTITDGEDALPVPEYMKSTYRSQDIDCLPLQGPLKTHFIQDLCSGNQDAEVALLLSLARDIRALEIASPSQLSHNAKPSWLDEVILDEIHLKSIKMLENWAAPSPPRWLSVLLRAATLHSVEGCTQSHTRPYRICKPRSSSVSRMIIYRSIDCAPNGADLIPSFIKGCKALRHFECFFEYCFEEEDAGQEWAEIPNVLSRHSDTLEILGLHTPGQRQYLWGNNDAIFSFSTFTALRKLSINQNMIVGDPDGERRQDLLVAALPASIESLVITHCEILTTYLQLRMLLCEISRFPHLRLIETTSARKWWHEPSVWDEIKSDPWSRGGPKPDELSDIDRQWIMDHLEAKLGNAGTKWVWKKTYSTYCKGTTWCE